MTSGCRSCDQRLHGLGVGDVEPAVGRSIAVDLVAVRPQVLDEVGADEAVRLR